MLFDIRDVTSENFNAHALRLFQYQYANVPVYEQFVDLLKVNAAAVNDIEDIPFLPISFFKSHKVIANGLVEEVVFESSTTTGAVPSKHYVANKNLYLLSCVEGFERTYGSVEGLCMLALLPSYLERGGSSLVWMVNALMNKSQHPANGFFLHDHARLTEVVLNNERTGQKTIVIGVSYALLDWAEGWNGASLQHTVIMETGGIKGRRKETIKSELHEALQRAFGVSAVHSEYGMTELLSQAYSTGHGIYRSPPWMRVSARDISDPLSVLSPNQTGALNVVDLANQYSCAFIATDDLGRVNNDGAFEVLGRLDLSEMRGCNLMVG